MRLFLAFDLDPDVHEWCDRWRRAVVAARPGAGPDLRWVAEQARHLTLKFIGEVGPVQASAIAEAVAAMELAPVPRLVAGALRWLPQASCARVLVLDVDPASPGEAGDGHPLSPVHREVEAVLAPLGVAADARAFTPHITLARVRNEGRTPWAAEVLSASRVAGTPPPIACDRLTLYESRLRPTGPEYRVVARTRARSTP